MQAKSLVLMLDAVVHDDDAMMRALIRAHPLMAKQGTLTADDIVCIYDVTNMVNHFYVFEGKFGVVLSDTPKMRALVDECNIDSFVFWGPNTDPVHVATAAHVAAEMEKSPSFTTPTAVIEFFTAHAINRAEFDDEAHKQRKRKLSQTEVAHPVVMPEVAAAAQPVAWRTVS